MRRPQCSRAWEAEAIEDGRLTGSALASFERHATSCAICTRERSALAALRSLGQSVSCEGTTPLDRKRLRASILRHANAEVVARPPSYMVLRYIAVAATFLIIALGAAALRRRAGVPLASPATPAPAPAFDVVPFGVAAWNVERSGTETHVAFSSGRVAVHVEKLSHEQRFVMTLPDGELEVRGTRFIVEVKDGHTQRVEVTEGSVALRLPPVREELLRAGDHWSAPETAPAGVPAPVAAPPVPPVVEPAVSLGVSSAPAHPPAARTSERSSHPTTAASQEAASAEAPTRSPAGEMFSSAMSAFSSGAYERADALLCEFTRTFPNDARAEDACFLRIAIRKRLGDATAVKARARDYLDQHPQGLRRAEVERLLQ